MSNNIEPDVIDLTNLSDNENGANRSVMEVSDDVSVLEISDSIFEESADQSVIVVGYVAADRARSVESKQTTPEVEKMDTTAKTVPEEPTGYACPICWEEFGKKSLISTKCGHIFCLKCFEEYMKYSRRCPTCRRWVGRDGYHRIYFNFLRI